MAEGRSRTTGCLFTAIAVCLAAIVVCCGGLCLGAAWAPDLLLGLVADDRPAQVAPAPMSSDSAAVLLGRLADDLEDDDRAALSIAEVNALIAANRPEGLAHGQVVAEPDGTLAVDVSLEAAPGQFVNVHAAGDFTMEQGWFTDLSFDALSVGPYDLGPYIAGQDMAPNANESLAQQRAQEPDVERLMRGVVELDYRDGTFVIELTDDAQQALRKK